MSTTDEKLAALAKDIISMVQRNALSANGRHDETLDFTIHHLREAVALARAEEREACAVVCENERVGANRGDCDADRYYDMACNDCATALRARLEGEA